MNLMSLENYRVRRADTYYDRGFYLADVISMHNAISEIEEVSVEFDFTDESDVLGIISSHKGRKIVRYNPFNLYNTESEDLLYIVAHEIAHIKNNDSGRITALKFMAINLYIIQILLVACLNLLSLVFIVWITPLLILSVFSVNRWLETMADIGALKYISKNNVLDQIKSREPRNKGGWLYYDHATTKSFTKWYGR